ncbi:MAG: fibronectin type III domain-containing protein, partial [Desulfobulbaceae bacterium]|nr:fibronectin type III domain-containing protein [Desulfobulbaceae bacterium]
MRSNPLFFLFLLFIIPTVSIAAEMRTLDVEFSFSAPEDPAKQLLGYQLYKEGEQVCETNDPSGTSIVCELLTEDGTFDFALTAAYSDNTESPLSPAFPFTIVSATPPNPEPPDPEPPT